MINLKQMTLALAVTTSLIASSAVVAESTANSTSTPSFYIDAGGAYALTDLENNTLVNNSYSGNIGNNISRSSATASPNGGFTFLTDLGYNINNHLAVEIGGTILPTGRFTTVASPSNHDYIESESHSHDISSSVIYGAGKISTSVTSDKVNAFAKVGLAHRTYKDKYNLVINYGNDVTHDRTDNDYTFSTEYWTGIFGTGASYDITSNIFATAEYDLIPGTYKNKTEGENTTVTRHIPNASIISAKIGYKFG